jgi:hypothetical protein
MKRHLSQEEQETVIVYNRVEDTCDIDTADPVVIARLDRLCETYPKHYRKGSRTYYEDGKVCSAQYKTKKRDVVFRKPRVYTDEQLAELRERGKRLAEKQKEARREGGD